MNAILLSMILFFASLMAPAESATRTLRLDYFHAGNVHEERFALDAVVLEGPWAGPLNQMIDGTNLGKYFFQVIDQKTSRVLYSRGFAGIYGEWETTGGGICGYVS